MVEEVIALLFTAFVWLAGDLFPPPSTNWNVPQIFPHPTNTLVIGTDSWVILNGESIPTKDLRARLLKEKFKNPSFRVRTVADVTPSNVETVGAILDMVRELDMHSGLATKPIKPKSATP
jgi:hypothetical protein